MNHQKVVYTMDEWYIHVHVPAKYQNLSTFCSVHECTFDAGLRTNIRRAYTEFQASFIEDHSKLQDVWM